MIADLTQNSGKSNHEAIKRRARRIEESDIQFIADCVAKGLTETNAVALLDKFTYSAWNCYKAKGKRPQKVAKLFARTIAARQNNLIENIADVADIDRAKTRGVRHDWRAAQMLAGLHDDRFKAQRDASTTTTNNTAVVIGAGGEQAVLKMLDGIFSQRQIAGQAVKQLPPTGDHQDDKPAV